MSYHWSPQQAQAIADVSAWYGSGSADQVYYLAGYAGTGKTTVAKHIVAETGAKPCYAAYTGKAAQVMRNSGCDKAGTLHSKMYSFLERNGKFLAVLETGTKSPIVKSDIIVVDECSMVDEAIGKDLMSFGKPILVLGDPEQLPPVKGAGYFTSREPNAMLTEIHRQAEGNPIIHMATQVREGHGVDFGKYGESAVVTVGEFQREYSISKFDQILVGLHKTRRAYTKRLREIKGYHTDHPLPGERMVCRRNDKKIQIFNGGMFTVKSSDPVPQENGVTMFVKSLDDPDRKAIEVFVRNEIIAGTKKPHWTELKNTQEMTFGYALTVHSAQGSQWDSVVIRDEAFGDREERRKWLYTAITRAAEQVVIIR